MAAETLADGEEHLARGRGGAVLTHACSSVEPLERRPSKASIAVTDGRREDLLELGTVHEERRPLELSTISMTSLTFCSSCTVHSGRQARQGRLSSVKRARSG